jgi:hypothetical protein
MAFSESVIITCFTRSGGRCECRRDHPEHRGHGRCKVRFSRSEGWVARPRVSSAPETVQNCELVCPECSELVDADRVQTIASSARA